MVRLITELTDAELKTRIYKLEEMQISNTRELSTLLSKYRKDILFRKRTIILTKYAEAILEAVYRDMITVH